MIVPDVHDVILTPGVGREVIAAYRQFVTNDGFFIIIVVVVQMLLFGDYCIVIDVHSDAVTARGRRGGAAAAVAFSFVGHVEFDFQGPAILVGCG